MANYLYNGVELPDIGAIWDKETHPHAFIYYNSLAGYTVRFSSGEISWKNTLQVLVPAPSVGYDLVDGTWVLESEKTSDYTFNFTSTYSGVWTNHDILNSDGSVYLAASDPIPVAPIDPTAMLLGWLTGRKVAGMRQRKPVAYLYNGVQLPALPEWDKETYPYAYISQNGAFVPYYGMYHLYYTSSPLAAIDGTTAVENGMANITKYYCLAGLWSGPNELADVSGTINSDYAPIWANTDVLNYDGTLYLSASEPVPVYE